MVQLLPVDHDPFGGAPAGPTLIPVDHDPFGETAPRQAAPGPQSATDLAFGGEDPAPGTPATDTPMGRMLGLPGAAYAAGAGALDGIPVVGPGLTAASNSAAAGIRSLRSGDPYATELKRIENYDAGTRAQYPTASTAGGVAGGTLGLAPAIVAAPALFGAGVAAPAARIAASTLSGGAIGAGDAAVRTGGDLDAVERGGMAGAGLGFAAPVLGAAVGAGVRKVGELTASRLAPTAGFGSAAAGKLADDVAASGGADAVRARLADLGPPAMLMDASPAFGGRAKGLATEPATRATVTAPLETRAAGANARIRGDVDQALGPAIEPDVVRAARQQSYDQNVRPMYRDALGQPVTVDTSDVLGTIRTLRSQEKGPAADALDRTWALLHHDGDVPGVGRATIPDRRPEALHNAKEALDAAIHQAESQYGSAGASTVARLSQVRGSLNGALERDIPGYRDANATARQYLAGRDAFDRGQTLLNGGRDAVRPGQLADETAGMSPMEIFMQRTGLRSEIDRHLGTQLNDRVALRNAIMGEGDFNRAKLGTVFGEEPTARLANTVDREAAFDRVHNEVVRGSQQAQAAAAARDIAPREISAGSTDVLPGLATIFGGADAGASALATKAGMGGLKLAASAAGRQADLARNVQLANAVTMGQGDRLDALLAALDRRGRMLGMAGSAGDAARIGAQAATMSQADRLRSYLPRTLPALPFVGR